MKRLYAALLTLALMAIPIAGCTESPAKAQEDGGGGLLSRLKEKTEKAVDSAVADESTTAELNYALLDLDGMVTEKGIPVGLGDFPMSLRGLLLKLRDLREDETVDGVVIRLHSVSAGIAKIQEVREALAELSAEKPVHIFCSNSGLGGLYLASAGTDITVPPIHEFFVSGIGFDLLYLSRMLDKLGVEPQVIRQGAYKGAMELFTETEATPETEEAYGALIDTIYDVIVGAIAEGRGLERAEVESAVSVGLLSAEDAVDRGLVDFIDNELEFYERIANQLGQEFELTEVDVSESQDFDTNNPFELFSMLMGEPQQRTVSENTIALVYLSGNIIDGGPEDAALEDEFISAYPIVNLLEEIREEENIETVVLRIDSGGGSAFASDRIWNAIVRLSETKPVVASLSDVAASGGYYIAVGADEIWAEPTTITGSIGVITGKFILAGFYDWIGVDLDTIARGRDVDLFNTRRPWTEKEESLLRQFSESVYEKFLSRVAAGRGMEVELVREIAEGRVWSGRDAMKIGLVDELGGLIESINRAKELAGLDPQEKYPLMIYPRRLTLAELLERTFGGFGASLSTSFPGLGEQQGEIARALGPAAALLPSGFVRHAQTLFHLLKQDRVALMMAEYVQPQL